MLQVLEVTFWGRTGRTVESRDEVDCVKRLRTRLVLWDDNEEVVLEGPSHGRIQVVGETVEESFRRSVFLGCDLYTIFDEISGGHTVVEPFPFQRFEKMTVVLGKVVLSQGRPAGGGRRCLAVALRQVVAREILHHARFAWIDKARQGQSEES